MSMKSPKVFPKGSLITKHKFGFIDVWETLKDVPLGSCETFSGVLTSHAHIDDYASCRDHNVRDHYTLEPSFKTMLAKLKQLGKKFLEKPKTHYLQHRHYQLSRFLQKYEAILKFVECNSPYSQRLHFVSLRKEADRRLFVAFLHELTLVRAQLKRERAGGRPSGHNLEKQEGVVRAIKSRINAGEKVAIAVSRAAQAHDVTERTAWRYWSNRKDNSDIILSQTTSCSSRH
jgi:hypothetical protein